MQIERTLRFLTAKDYLDVLYSDRNRCFDKAKSLINGNKPYTLADLNALYSQAEYDDFTSQWLEQNAEYRYQLVAFEEDDSNLAGKNPTLTLAHTCGNPKQRVSNNGESEENISEREKINYIKIDHYLCVLEQRIEHCRMLLEGETDPHKFIELTSILTVAQNTLDWLGADNYIPSTMLTIQGDIGEFNEKIIGYTVLQEKPKKSLKKDKSSSVLFEAIPQIEVA